MKAKLDILWIDFNCDIKSFMTFIMVTIKRSHKSVLSIGLLSLEKTSFDLVVSHGKALFMEDTGIPYGSNNA
jgi:hypothetical protein